MKVIGWNTGALYTTMGQRIVAARVAEDALIFVDCDRMIDGQIPIVNSWYEGEDGGYKQQQLVMAAYNFGNYNGVGYEHRETMYALHRWGEKNVPGYKDPNHRRDQVIVGDLEMPE